MVCDASAMALCFLDMVMPRTCVCAEGSRKLTCSCLLLSNESTKMATSSVKHTISVFNIYVTLTEKMPSFFG